MGGRIPGPQCQATKPQWILDGTMNRQCTANRQPLVAEHACVGRSSAPQSIPTLIFDGEQLLRFFRSVAFAKVTARNIKLEWVPYKDSKVLNIIYGLMPWKGEPGTVEVKIENEQMSGVEMQKEADHFMDLFLEKLAEKPASATAYLSGLENIRQMCLQDIQNVYTEAQAISRELIAETQRGIQRLSQIKLASTVALKTAGLVAPAPSFLISLGYDVTLEYIKELGKTDDATMAGIVGIKKELVEIGKHKIENTAEHQADKLLRKGDGYKKEMEALEKKIEDVERQLERKIKQSKRSKFQTRLETRKGELAAQQKGLKGANLKAKGLSAVKYLFFAYDMFEAYHEYQEETSFKP